MAEAQLTEGDPSEAQDSGAREEFPSRQCLGVPEAEFGIQVGVHDGRGYARNLPQATKSKSPGDEACGAGAQNDTARRVNPSSSSAIIREMSA